VILRGHNADIPDSHQFSIYWNSGDTLEWRSVKRTAIYEILVSDLKVRIRVARMTLTDRHSGHLTYLDCELIMLSAGIRSSLGQVNETVL